MQPFGFICLDLNVFGSWQPLLRMVRPVGLLRVFLYVESARKD